VPAWSLRGAGSSGQRWEAVQHWETGSVHCLVRRTQTALGAGRTCLGGSLGELNKLQVPPLGAELESWALGWVQRWEKHWSRARRPSHLGEELGTSLGALTFGGRQRLGWSWESRWGNPRTGAGEQHLEDTRSELGPELGRPRATAWR
jgi:hypothetical protein